MRLIVFFLLAALQFGTFSLSAQITLKGMIVEFETGRPVEFANIGVINKSQGTVSDFDGTFSLTVDENYIGELDTVQVSRIGYETIKLSAKSFRDSLVNNPTINLKPQPYELDGITVTSSDAEKRRIGYQSNSKSLYGFWNDSLALGGEHASKIMVRRGPLKLEDISFNMIANISDSLLVRVNVYEIEKGLPGKNISNGNILHTIKQKQGTIRIDLSPYNIVVSDHFIISLELLKVYGDRIWIGMSASNNGFRSYTRLVSQGKWKRMRKGFTVAFNLNTSAVDKQDFAHMPEGMKKREKPKSIKILWDTSISMKGRAKDAELKFLTAYFKNLNDIQVLFQPFSNFATEEKIFNVSNGDWSALKEEMESLVYDGGPVQSLWNQLEISENTLLFTDGKNFPEDVGKDWYGTLFTVNGNPNANHSFLKELAEDHSGSYINLEKLDNEMAISYTKFYLLDNLEYGTKKAVTNFSIIRGNVGDLDMALPNVLVKVRGTNREARTDSKGNFSIEAHNGEILDFSHPGREDASSMVNTSSAMLKIIMPIGITALDEVVLEENLGLKVLHKPLNKNISTRFGALDMEKTGFAVKQMQGSEINPSSQTIMDAIIGKFPGVKVTRKYPEDYQVVLLRGKLLAWDVDGHVYPPERPPFHINMHNIKDITIMPPSWSAAKYGRLAPGGIIIVRTISNTFDTAGLNKNHNDIAAENFYKNDASELADGIHSKPLYAQRIANSKTISEAYSQYLKERENYGHIPSFYFEAAKIFDDIWMEKRKAKLVRSNIYELFTDETEALKILAYSFEEQGYPLDALEIYKQIHSINKTPQSKRDLAKVLAKNGKYEEAWNMYKSYIDKQNDFGNTSLDKLVKGDILTFIKNHGHEIGLDKSKFRFDDMADFSLILEWNDPNAQFELQFVDSENHYYNWNSTTEITQEENESGGLSNMFDMNQLQNRWLINMTYSGNQANLPTFLKFTLRNNQTGDETVKMITLRQRNVKYKVMEITNQEMLFY